MILLCDGRAAAALASTCLALAGCGGGWEATVYPATGRVTVNGRPAAGALVQLQPVGEKSNDARSSRPWGVVQADGTYTLTTYDDRGPGAPAGEYRFTMTWPPDVSVPSTEDKLKRRFADPATSRWTFTIRPGENALPPVEIDGIALDATPRPRRGVAGPPGNPNDPALLKMGDRRAP